MHVCRLSAMIVFLWLIPDTIFESPELRQVQSVLNADPNRRRHSLPLHLSSSTVALPHKKKKPSAELSVHCLDCRRELNLLSVLNYSHLQQPPEAKKLDFACEHFACVGQGGGCDCVRESIQTMDCEQLPDASEALLQALGPIICRASNVEQSEDSNICLKMKQTGFKVCCCYLFFSKA